MRSAEVIINRGRGPEIEGTRITVYDVLDWLIQGWHPHRIAAFFRIRSAQVEAAIEYIREHTLEVITNYQKILERCARGNPPRCRRSSTPTTGASWSSWPRSDNSTRPTRMSGAR
jgi:uncharacterized protein (DUF433 family)